MRHEARRSERGTVTLEAALTLLFFFVFVLGAMEAGRFMNVQGTLTNAAREGARLAVAPAPQTSTLPSAADVEAEVRRFIASASIPDADVSVLVQPVTGGDGTLYTQVTAQMPYRVMTLSMFGPLEITLSGNSRMRNETSP